MTEVKIKLETHDFGGCAIDKTGEPLPAQTLKACQDADAILMGMPNSIRIHAQKLKFGQDPSVVLNGA